MVKNWKETGMVLVMLLAAGWTKADVCEIVNGSFEDDGLITDIAIQEPNGWLVSMPSGKFTGKTDASWSTDGSFSLFIFSQWFKPFSAGDMATVSQQVYLADVNEITFDLKLDTYSGLEWDPNDVTAVVLIDDDVVWEPNNTDLDIKGVYPDQAYVVEDRYRDENLHKLSLGLRVNVDAEIGFFDFYRVWWDSIECTSFCGGGGLLAGDFNHDCYINAHDLDLTADVWLAETPSYNRHNLFHGDDLAGYGTINFFDLAVFANNWLRSSYEEDQQVVTTTGK